MKLINTNLLKDHEEFKIGTLYLTPSDKPRMRDFWEYHPQNIILLTNLEDSGEVRDPRIPYASYVIISQN